MQPSLFNVTVPLPERNEVFLMNTFSDAQLLVSPDVTRLLDRIGRGDTTFNDEEREAVDTLVEDGFLVESPERERTRLGEYFKDLREDKDQLRVTVLTTLQCNFACDYCFQGDHDDYNKFAAKMTLDRARQLVKWIEGRLDEVRPRKFILSLFGGEPLLNLPAAYYLAEQCHAACERRGVPQYINIITNGLLLTPEIVDRLLPYGLGGIKITLDETELVFGPLYIEGDLFALNRVYRNLITNSLQATPPQGRVVVRTFRQNGQAVIEVADTGCGIPSERLETIFDDFATTKRRGLGLGLAISKKIVEQLGGTIAVASEVGVGSTFSIRLPLTKARPAAKLAAG